MRISVIIPALDEQESLRRLLPRLAGADVTVVDGGSLDATRDVVRAAPGVKLLQADPPRSRQLNRAASEVTGEVIFFLHADALPPDDWPERIAGALQDPGTVGGAFDLDIDAPGLRAWIVSRGATLRTRLTHIPYGDQGIFVRRRVFEALGGFAPLPFMEDLEFSRRLKRRGRLRLVPAPVRVSARRWQRDGYLRSTLRNVLLAGAYYVGADWQRLGRWREPVRENGSGNAVPPTRPDPT